MAPLSKFMTLKDNIIKSKPLNVYTKKKTFISSHPTSPLASLNLKHYRENNCRVHPTGYVTFEFIFRFANTLLTCFIKLLAIWPPMLPKPMKPIFLAADDVAMLLAIISPNWAAFLRFIVRIAIFQLNIHKIVNCKLTHT